MHQKYLSSEVAGCKIHIYGWKLECGTVYCLYVWQNIRYGQFKRQLKINLFV